MHHQHKGSVEKVQKGTSVLTMLEIPLLGNRFETLARNIAAIAGRNKCDASSLYIRNNAILEQRKKPSIEH